MHKIVAAIVFVIVAALGIHVPTAAAATSSAKVVIVVGAVQGSTSSYRQSANAVYEEAIKYSSNVKKVYSPNATWSKVKAAMAGANIVVYLGHGNGFPSRYSPSPRPSSQNGFGLNTPTNPSDNTHQYYGEQYIDDVDLAPNAIVLLQRLCYASGAGEPQYPEPTLKISTARARVDNYAAGFIRAGARAVIADGHRSVSSYIRALFTTSQTIDQLWRSTNSYGHVSTFGSSRSSGFTGYLDPKTSGGVDYYRSMVAKPSVTTRQITGVVGDTGVDPASFAVPGRASVKVDGAALLSPTTLLATGTTLPLGTRLAVVSRPIQITSDGNSLLEVTGLDDPGISGFARAIDLTPRDSTAPLILSTDTSSATFSPNDDDAVDTTTVTAQFSEAVSWRVRFTDGDGDTLAEKTGSGVEAVATWDGLVSGSPVADGSYGYTVLGEDAWENAPAKATGTVRVDTTAPTMSGVGEDTPAPWFSPNGDGFRDTTKVSGSVSETGKVIVRVRRGDTTVRTFAVDVKAGTFAVTWNGHDDDGDVVPNGTYELRLSPRDAVSNTGDTSVTTVLLNNVLGSVKASPRLFYPQDKDSLSTKTTLSFRLAQAATVTWTLRNASGDVVATFYDAVALEPGLYSRSLYGRNMSGVMLPTGSYKVSVSATDGDVTSTQAASFEMNAFSMKASDSTPGRGQRVSVTVVSAEKLARPPRLYIHQPGKTTWSVAMTKVSTRTYKATFTVRTGGSSGTVTFRAKAIDARGNVNQTRLRLPLH